MLKPLSGLIRFSLTIFPLGGFLFFSSAALFAVPARFSAVPSAASLTQDTSSPDAIAIRVMANDNHYSALRWYKEQKFSGSPQNLLVDGYEAVRDGRTVYVDAANIDTAKNELYTNIYIISYNQAAEPSTVDIFGQILAHWKFNSNISDPAEKQKIIRDTRRLADLADLKTYLEKYKIAKNDYPRLPAGSYIAGASVSKWPSWQATLAKELGATLPVDPINKLNSCSGSGYDTETCWNQGLKQFAFNFVPDTKNSKDPNSVARSNVYWYKDGQFYVNLETSYTIKGEGINYINLNTGLRFDPKLQNLTFNQSQDNKDNISYQVRVYDPYLANQNLYNLTWRVDNDLKISPTKVKNIANISGTLDRGEHKVTITVEDGRLGDVLIGSSTISVVSRCGNGKIDAGEDCDFINGTAIGLTGWSCLGGNGLGCNDECKASCINGTAYKGSCGDKKWQSPPEKCDATAPISGAPANAICNSDCNGWTCDNANGYHSNMDNSACDKCQADNATSVKWESDTCKATACKDQTLNSGYHVDSATGQCASNTESKSCLNPDSILEANRYWDNTLNGGQGGWGVCQATKCNEVNGYYLFNGNCGKCEGDKHIESGACVANSRNCDITAMIDSQTVKVGAGTQTWDGTKWPDACQLVSCDQSNGYHLNYKGDGCTKDNLAVCADTPIVNGAMESAWLGDYGWGSCVMTSTNPEFPFCFNGIHPQYPGQKVCVNACGSTSTTLTITDRWHVISDNSCSIYKMTANYIDNTGAILKTAVSGMGGITTADGMDVFDLIYTSNVCKFILQSDPVAKGAALGDGCAAEIAAGDTVDKTKQFNKCVSIPFANPYDWNMDTLPDAYLSDAANCFSATDAKLFPPPPK